MSLKVTSIKHRGRRPYMEDEISCHENNEMLYSAIFDGHGGNACSKFLYNYFWPTFLKKMQNSKNIKSSLTSCCKELNEYVLRSKCTKSGSTINITVLDKKNGKIHVCNVGDSRTLSGTSDGKHKQISKDHTPATEKKFIQSHGGKITDEQGVLRINGILNVGRAFGDIELANVISCKPDIFEENINQPKFSFLLQSSDGLFDVFDNEQICRKIQNLLNRNVDPRAILKRLLSEALSRGAEDNISIILLTLNSR